MAGRPVIQAIGPSYNLLDRKSAVQRSVNLFMRQVEGIGEDKQVVLDSAPGLTLLVDLSAEVRGMRNVEGVWYVVAGNTLYRMTTAGVTTTIGTLVTYSGFVCMTHGQNQLVLTDGTNGYVYNISANTFAQITDADWRGSEWCDFLDGYTIFVDQETEQFYISAIDDASSLDALDFSSADTRPDNIVTHRVFKRELLLFGRTSTEVWINSGDPDFPFARYNSTPIEIGTVGRRAVCVCADSIIWVGQTDRGAGYVYRMTGHQPVRISTQAVEEAIRTATDLSEIVTWTYHDAGSEFFALSAPGMETTWVWDAATQQWHERGEWAAGWSPLRIDQVVFVGGTHYATAGTKVYSIDREAYTLAGDVLLRERTWPHLASRSFEPIVYRSLQIGCTTGNGGSITLECSNDGGFTWLAPLQRSLGAVGRWMQQVRWLFLGSSYDRVFRLRCSDAVPLTIHTASVET